MTKFVGCRYTINMSTQNDTTTSNIPKLTPDQVVGALRASYASWLEMLTQTSNELDKETRMQLWEKLSNQPHPMSVIRL